MTDMMRANTRFHPLAWLLIVYLTGPDGQAAASSMAGGLQGAPGTLFGIPYSPGSLGDLIVEAYAGTHDFISGQLVGLYDDQGNAKRGMSSAEKTAHDVWSAVAIVPAAPFAAATVLPSQVWNAIAAILQVLK